MQKSIVIFLACIVAISFVGCQEKEDPDETGPVEFLGNSPEEMLYKGYNLLDLGHTNFYEFAGKNNGNAPAALYATGKLLFDTGIPQDVYIVDSTYMYIVMDPDITMLFRIDYVDEIGKSVYRGGPNGGNRLLRLLNDNSCSDAIPNNKVLLWGAADNLPFNYSRIKNTLSESDFEFEVTALMHEQCTPSTLKTLDQYGLVLLDTHGMPDAILTGSKISFPEGANTLKKFKEVMVASLSQDGYDDFLKGNLMASWAVVTPEMGTESWWKNGNSTKRIDGLEVWADMRFLENLPDLSNTIIFNNSCYSGATVNEIKNGNINGVPVNLVKTETVANAFLGRSPIAYYGWNHDDLSAGPVGNDFATQAEENLIKRLADSADSTGMAHRRADGSYFEFSYPPKYPEILRLNLFNKDSYCYQDPCEDSFTDPRDGQEYKTVCIGKQVWMAENLRATKYNDNTPIATGHNDTQWVGLTTGAYAIYPHGSISGLNSDAEVLNTYGALYNWFAVDAEQGLCPTGWRVPTDADWTELVNYVVGQGYSKSNVVEGVGNALKSCRQINHPNGGDCAKLDHPRWDAHNTHYGTDEFGFSSLPGGYRSNNGSYGGIGGYGSWWSSTEYTSSQVLGRSQYYNTGHLGISRPHKISGLCVRCIKQID
jgi:uncharacterized protein (TIGR02145 family)